MAYGNDILTGGTASADAYDVGYEPAKGCDNNEATRWSSGSGALPHWWKYDLGAGITKQVKKLRLKVLKDGSGTAWKNFTLQGSNNDSDWTTIHTGVQADNDSWQDYEFTNATAYRYYKLNITTNYRGDAYASPWEIEMMEEQGGGSFLLNMI